MDGGSQIGVNLYLRTALQTDDDSGCYAEDDELARCQDSGGTVALDQAVRDVRL